MNQPRAHRCSPPRTPNPPPSPSHPPGSSQCTSPEHPVSCIKPDQRSDSHIIYTFQCYPLKSSHPHLLPESKRLFFTSVSLLLSHIQGYHYHLSKFHIYALVYCIGEKAMAPHSSTLAWKISWTEELGRLRSMGSQRVGHDWVTSLSLFTFMHWRRKWQPTPVFLPGESQGRGRLVGCHLWGHTELDTTEVT